MLKQPADRAHLPRNHGKGGLSCNGANDAPCRFGWLQNERHRVRVNLSHRRLDVTRANRHHLDAAAAQLDAQRFQIGDGGRLGGRIGTRPGQTAKPGNTGDTHQSTSAGLAHRRNKRLESLHHAQHVDVHHLLESLPILGIFGKRADADPGVGNNHIRHADSRHEIASCPSQGGGIAHIQRVAINLIGKFQRECLQQISTAGKSGHTRATLKIMARQR